MTSHVAAMAVDWSAEPLFDRDRIDEYAGLMDRALVVRLLTTFAHELTARPDEIRRKLHQQDVAAARAAAHLLRGAALGIGARRIAALAGAIEVVPDDAVPALADALPACADATLARVEDVAAAFRAA